MDVRQHLIRLCLIGISLSCCYQGSWAQSPLSEADTVLVTLESAVQRALEISPEIGIVGAERDFAVARWKFAKAHRFLSEFEAVSAHSTSPGLKNDEGVPRGQLYLDPDVRNDWDIVLPFSRVEFGLVQPIYTWGEVSGNIRAAEHGIAVEEGAIRSKKLEVAARTGEIYYSLLLADALFRLAEDASGIVDRAINEIETQLDEGATEVDDADLFQVQITEQEVNRRVVEVEQKRHTTRSALARQMLLPDGTVPDIGNRILTAVPFELQDLAYYQDLSLFNRPEIAQTDAGLAARTALVGVARSDYYPKLFAAVNAKYSFALDRFRQRNPYVSDPFLSRGVQAGVGFRQKLNFGQTRAKVEQAKSEADQVRFQGEAARQLILFEVEDAYRNVIIARSAVDSQAEALRISKNWLRSEEINFDLDLGDTENLVRAVKSNLELQAASFQTVYDYNVAVLKLLKTTGILTQTLQSGTFVE